MSEKPSQSTKAKDGKTKYATLSLFNTYKGKTLETQKTTGMFVKTKHLLGVLLGYNFVLCRNIKA